MSTVPTDAAEPVSFKSITIISEKIPVKGGRVDITNGVSNIDIYEHLDKAYLTGAIAFRDSQDIISSMDIGGGEKVEIVVQSTRDDTKPVSKTFYLDNIVASSKLGDNVEFFILHLIEDIGYISNLKNVNKHFSDNPYEIIKGISKSYLDKTVESSGIGQKTMDVIVPNLNPIEAMSWIKNMTCTSDGYPFYLTSTLVNDELAFVDLETLLSAPVMNKGIPYTYGQATMSVGGSPQDTSQRRVIKEYNFSDTEDLFTLIKKGLVGADYSYIDVTAKSIAWTMFDDNAENHYKFNKFTFKLKDVVDDLLKIKESPYYSDKYKVNSKSFHEFKSRSITQIGSTQAYEKGSSINQSESHAKYKLNIINRSIDQLMKKNPLTLSVNGVDFLDGDAHQTVGRKIEVRFMRNTAPEDTDYYFDNKKSGDYLIFSAKHSFDRSTYVVSLSCLKLSNGDV